MYVIIKNRMKKTLTTIFLIGAVKFIFAQSYFNFPDSNTVWTYLRCDIIPLNPTAYQSCNTQYFTISGDTVINSLTYHKIYYDTVPNQFNHYYAAVREDSLKKVYVISMGTSENLKFNFSGNIGDTMQINPIKKIIGIDSVLISGTYRKRFILSSNDTIIEGIGNINSVIGFYTSSDPVSFTLLCMTTNNNLIYQSSQYLTCDTAFYIPFVGINTTELDKYFKIYPNPTAEYLYIDFTDWSKEASISLYDVTGQMLVNKQTLFNGINILQVSPFAQGMYFYQIFSDNEVLKSGKVVIQK